MYMNQRFVFAL